MTQVAPVFDHLRVVETVHLDRYFAAQRDMLEFVAAVHSIEPEIPQCSSKMAVFHSWLPGFVEAESSAFSESPLFEKLAARGWTEDRPLDLDALVRKTLVAFPAIQNPVELKQFLERVQARRPRVVVEIGTASGGVFYCLSQLMARDGLLVSIDVPFAPPGEEAAGFGELFASFAPRGQRIERIPDSSFHYSTRQDLLAILDGRKIDLLFIDGDHTYAGVKSDASMYAPLVAPGGLIAFHDICMHPDTWGRGNDVGVYWNELRAGGRGVELIDPNGSKKAPRFDTPVGFEMPALGFGLVEAPL